jgi:lipoprotein-anchoring transpeptidase ErfK/SrfK
MIPTLPRELALASRRRHVPLTRHVLVVSVARQQVLWFERTPPCPDHALRRRLRASTSRYGIGQVRDTRKTPLGLHRVARKIGAGWPVGTAFRARQVVGFTWDGAPGATIAHRILWLEGLEPGFNRGGDVDTFSRYIYVHGLADEPTLGRPASHGCVHLAAADLLPLFDRVPVGTLVWIAA